MAKFNCKQEKRKLKKTKNYYIQKLKCIQNFAQTKNESECFTTSKVNESFKGNSNFQIKSKNIIIQKNQSVSNIVPFYSQASMFMNVDTSKNQQKQQDRSFHKISKQKKLGKIVAKDARQRKKIYITFLQESNKSLQEKLKLEVQKNTKMLQQTKSQKLTQTQNQTQFNTNKLQKQFQKLHISLSKHNEEQVSRSLDVLRARYGISGRQRKAWVHYFLQKSVQLFMPMHFRLLMEYSQNNLKFYDLLGGNQSMKQFKNIFKEELTKNILLETRPLILDAKTKYQKQVPLVIFRLLTSLHQLQEQFNKLSQESQTIIDRIENNLNPLFVGKLLINLDIQRNKNEQMKTIFPLNFYKQKCYPTKFFSSTMQAQKNQCKVQSQETKRTHLSHCYERNIIEQDINVYFTQFQIYDNDSLDNRDSLKE